MYSDWPGFWSCLGVLAVYTVVLTGLAVSSGKSRERVFFFSLLGFLDTALLVTAGLCLFAPKSWGW